MIKKGLLFLTFVLSAFGLFACADTTTTATTEATTTQSLQDILLNAYPENNAYYEVLVRSFADSDGDGIGDFNGLADKLDYFVDLGITGLWLMPINPSPTYHGYDVTDYYAVNPDYGTMEDFENLVAEANSKGITIMLDMVFNHTSNQHPWFLAALEGDETYRDYYVFSNEDNGEYWHGSTNGNYYGYFSYTMPDLNLENPAVFDEIVNISKFWMDKGVMGFRLDAVSHFYSDNEYLDRTSTYVDNIIFLQDYMDAIDEYNSDVYVIGEVWEEDLYQVVGDYFGGLDAPIDFPVSAIIRSAAQSTSNRRYASLLEEIYDYYRRINKDFISAPFVANHDMDRFATMVLGNTDMERMAAEMLLTLPGDPILYYGEELGMFGYKTNGENGIWDETRRLPFLWDDPEYLTDWLGTTTASIIDLDNKNSALGGAESQMLDSSSLWNVYATLLQLRNENIALKYGNSFEKWELSTSSLQGFYREFTYEGNHQKLLILHNFANEATDMIEFNGTILYASNLSADQFSSMTSIPAKTTLIIELTE